MSMGESQFVKGKLIVPNWMVRHPFTEIKSMTNSMIYPSYVIRVLINMNQIHIKLCNNIYL